jgi:hypothetical protein
MQFERGNETAVHSRIARRAIGRAQAKVCIEGWMDRKAKA